MSTPFWESAEIVERFAAREPDTRLTAMLPEFAAPSKTRVLDIGCAGGRNAVPLARAGFDVTALDASPAMVAKTRERLAPILGAGEAERRVRAGRMDDLSFAGDASFDLVLALGIYHCAASRAEWDRALSETARVLKPGGRLIVSVFTPETDLDGLGTRAVPGEPDIYEMFADGGRHVLVDAEQLDREMARFGLTPLEPTRTARPKLEKGRRVSANGVYVRTMGSDV